MGQLLDKYDADGGAKIDQIIDERYGDYIRFILNASGVYMPVRNGQWIWSLIRIIFYFMLVLYASYILLITGTLTTYDFNLVAQCVHYAIVALLALLFLSFCILNRRKINTILNIIGHHFNKYENDEIVKELADWKSNIRHTQIMILSIVIVFFALLVISILGGPFIDILAGYTKKPQIEYIDTRLPIDIWHPYSKQSTTSFIIYLTLEIASGGVIGLLIAAIAICSIFVFMSVILQLKILNNSISLIKEKSARYHQIHIHEAKKNKYINKEKLKRMSTKDECKICIQRCIKEIVEHHLIIVKVFEIFQQICLIPTTAALVAGLIAIAISLFALVMEDSNPSGYIVSFLLLICEVASLAMICYFGQQIKDKSIETQDVLFETEWLTFPKEVTSSMSIMMERLKRPLVFKAGGFAPCTYETFSSIMRASYNLFKVLVLAKDGRLTVITNRLKNRQ